MNTPHYRIDLIRQMSDCDANFIRLLKLMPELESFRTACFNASSSGCESHTDDAPVFQMHAVEGNAQQNEEESLRYAREFQIHSSSEEAIKIRISVLEVFRYTSTLVVTQMNRISPWISPPSIVVRVYHDAATAEAVAYQGHRAFLAKYAIPNPRMYHQDEKRQINEFLGEWLSLCLQAGHSVKAPSFICAA